MLAAGRALQLHKPGPEAADRLYKAASTHLHRWLCMQDNAERLAPAAKKRVQIVVPDPEKERAPQRPAAAAKLALPPT